MKNTDKIIDKIIKLFFGEPIVKSENKIEDDSKVKTIKIIIKWPYIDDIIEEHDIEVPIGLSEEEENKYIDDIIERDYAHLYGR